MIIGGNMDPDAGMSHDMTEGLSDPSSPESSFDDSELFQTAMADDVTSQLAAAGNKLKIIFNSLNKSIVPYNYNYVNISKLCNKLTHEISIRL
jgi:hypothetical protein